MENRLTFSFTSRKSGWTIRIKPLGIVTLTVLSGIVAMLAARPWTGTFPALALPASGLARASESGNLIADETKLEVGIAPGMVYDNRMRNGWKALLPPAQDEDNVLDATARVYGIGAENRSLRIRFGAASESLTFERTTPLSLKDFSRLVLHLNGAAIGGQQLRLSIRVEGRWQAPVILDPLPSEQWVEVRPSLTELTMGTDLATTGAISEIALTTREAQPVFYVDDIHLE